MPEIVIWKRDTHRTTTTSKETQMANPDAQQAVTSPSDSESKIEKALATTRATRVELEKAQPSVASVALNENIDRLAKAERELQLEYLRKTSGAFSPEREAQRDHIRKVEQGLGA
jgi:hypothetical protein